MRVLIALPLLAAAACNVSTDDANDSVTVEYNQDVAENGLRDAGNLAADVAADVENTAEKIGDKVENTDVDVDVKTDGAEADANAN